MYWCKECNRPLADPLIATEYEIHREVDDRRYERFEIPYCPACGHEVYEAKTMQLREVDELPGRLVRGLPENQR